MSLAFKSRLRRFADSGNQRPQERRPIRRTRKFVSCDGIDFVRCRICGDHRRVISGRHLSKHGTDRETYMEEYRLSPDELIAKDFRRIQSSHPGYQPYDQNEWIRAVKRINRAGGSVFAGDLQRTHPYVYSQGVWLFGDWDKALRAAGLDPERARKRRFWEQESIITQIHRMRNRRVPLYASYAMRNHPKVFYGGLRVFGSWDNPLRAAGIAFNGIRGKSRLGWLKQLQETEESGREISQKLRSAIGYYFGSLRKARIALKTDPTFLRSWSKRKIIAPLSTGTVQNRHWLTSPFSVNFPPC